MFSNRVCALPVGKGMLRVPFALLHMFFLHIHTFLSRIVCSGFVPQCLQLLKVWTFFSATHCPRCQNMATPCLPVPWHGMGKEMEKVMTKQLGLEWHRLLADAGRFLHSRPEVMDLPDKALGQLLAKQLELSKRLRECGALRRPLKHHGGLCT